jgi:tetratricopeptide (TPR) repeat protein
VDIERARRKPTENLDAYDHYLRGMASVHLWTKEGNADALDHFYKAIEIDPKYASAYGLAARCYSQRKAAGWNVDAAWDAAETARLVKRAVELGPDDALALCTSGLALSYVIGDAEEGDALTSKALAHNPNLAWAWLFSGWTKLWIGEFETALERLNQALRLSPNDPQIFLIYDAMCALQFCVGRYEESLNWATKALRGRTLPLVEYMAVACAAHLGREEEAHQRLERIVMADPSLRISRMREKFPELRRPEDFDRLAEGLRKAGLPD